MICRECNSSMEKYDDEGSFGFASFDSYVCPNCLTLFTDFRKPSDRQEWEDYKSNWYKDEIKKAIAHLIKWKGYKLVKDTK